MNKSPLVSKWQRADYYLWRNQADQCRTGHCLRQIWTKEGLSDKVGVSGQTLLLNARVETTPFKATFKEAWASHRCIVPATCYYDWQHVTGNDGKKRAGEKYMFQPKGSSMT